MKNPIHSCHMSVSVQRDLSTVRIKQISTCEVLLDTKVLMSSSLVDDLELVSLLEAQVAIMVGLIAVYGHHQVVCEADIVKLT